VILTSLVVILPVLALVFCSGVFVYNIKNESYGFAVIMLGCIAINACVLLWDLGLI
jgi:hypothetical protein